MFKIDDYLNLNADRNQTDKIFSIPNRRHFYRVDNFKSKPSIRRPLWTPVLHRAEKYSI